MPNHITNKLKASPAVLAALKGPEAAVDFNTMIPMAPELKDVVSEGGATSLAELLTGQIDLRKSGDLLQGLKLSNVLQMLTDRRGIEAFREDKDFENFVQMLRNWRKHGALCWYDWACEHWSTKWNAYAVSECAGGVQFDTAWSAPHPVIKTLADKFPDERIEHQWADEDIGSNLGHRVYQLGKVTDIEVRDPIYFALAVTGHDSEGYRANPTTGLWEYHETQ